MTQRADIAGQTAGAGTGPQGDGTSGGAGGYSSGQTSARVMLGAIVAVCVVGLVWVLWPAERAMMTTADRGAQSETADDGDGETPGTDTMSVAPGTDRVEDLSPDAAGTDPADAGDGAGVDPDLDPTTEDEARDGPEIDPTDTVPPVGPDR